MLGVQYRLILYDRMVLTPQGWAVKGLLSVPDWVFPLLGVYDTCDSDWLLLYLSLATKSGQVGETKFCAHLTGQMLVSRVLIVARVAVHIQGTLPACFVSQP